MKKPRVLSNVGWNLSGTIINVLTGFITLPYLIGQFGAETYGIWILIGAVVAYFSLLDCGVALAVGRLVAKARLTGDIESLNEFLSTGGAVLGFVCILACTFVFVGSPFFLDLFHVAPAQSRDVHRALVICGLLAALTLPTLIASAVLWGYERFDLYNMAEITSTLLRMTLIFVFINRESHLESLAWISVASTTISVLGLASACYFIEPRITLSVLRFRWSTVRELYAFSGWYTVFSFGKTFSSQVSPFIIGAYLGAKAVTNFSIARQLVVYSSLAVSSGSQALAPRAALSHFGEQLSRQRELFLMGGRFAFAFSAFVVGGFICFGRPFIRMWQPTLPDEVYNFLLVLTIGEALPISQCISNVIILGMGKHRSIAIAGVVEGITILFLGVLTISKFGLIGACLTVAIAAFVFRGILPLTYTCILLKIPLRRYLLQVLGPFLTTCVVALVFCESLAPLYRPSSWVELVIMVGGYGIVSFVAVGPVILGWQGSLNFLRKHVRTLV